MRIIDSFQNKWIPTFIVARLGSHVKAELADAIIKGSSPNLNDFVFPLH